MAYKDIPVVLDYTPAAAARVKLTARACPPVPTASRRARISRCTWPATG
ncbi:MAG: hypothetical protein V3R75_07445 [Alphaproteobacteria bacterium]